MQKAFSSVYLPLLFGQPRQLSALSGKDESEENRRGGGKKKIGFKWTHLHWNVKKMMNVFFVSLQRKGWSSVFTP